MFNDPTLPGYYQMYTIKNRHLEVLDDNNQTLWVGKVKLEYKRNFHPCPSRAGEDKVYGQQSIRGYWVHGFQKDLDPELWADMFFKSRRAILSVRPKNDCPFKGNLNSFLKRFHACTEKEQREYFSAALYSWLGFFSDGSYFIIGDVARNTPEAEQVIHDAMMWLGLSPDITFKQSDRLSHYRELALMLIDNNLAIRDGDAIRLSFKDPSTSWQDTVSGNISITDNDRQVVDGLVLMRSDGNPTYHFASVVDDMVYGVTWVVRGSDHMSNTAKHIAIWNALLLTGATTPLPLFTHVGLITQNGKKISKRDGSASMLDYRDRGINPDAMFNWLLRMGWGPTIDDKTTAKISRERAVELFLDGGKMKASPANMDMAKLESFDRKYKAMIESALKL